MPRISRTLAPLVWMTSFAILVAASVGPEATRAQAADPEASAGAPLDWQRYADERTVEVVTRDEDESDRVTTIWIVVVDGQAYIRTGGTHWGDNLERDRRLVLRVASDELPLRVEFVADPATREAVIAAFRAKYGLMDRLIAVFRSGTPRIMRLVPRE